ncbi:MAG: CopG family transcriptional regulator [Deltaproteobacteria bacterium]|nr:CopG family transcriptional regulator [Deltaproteobacteria bacterium]
MVRSQVQFDEATYEEVRRLAFRERTSFSAAVRSLVRRGLDSGEGRRRFARKAPLSFVAAGASGRGDISERHDEYLAEPGEKR